MTFLLVPGSDHGKYLTILNICYKRAYLLGLERYFSHQSWPFKKCLTVKLSSTASLALNASFR